MLFALNVAVVALLSVVAGGCVLYARKQYRLGYEDGVTKDARRYEKTMEEIGVGENDLGILSGTSLDTPIIGSGFVIPKEPWLWRVRRALWAIMPWKRWSIVQKNELAMLEAEASRVSRLEDLYAEASDNLRDARESMTQREVVRLRTENADLRAKLGLSHLPAKIAQIGG